MNIHRYAQSAVYPSRSGRSSSARTYTVQSGARGMGGGGGWSSGTGFSRGGGGGSFALSSAMGLGSGMGIGLGGGGGGGGGASSFMAGGMGLIGDEKNAMQNLNDRLATYLAKVQQLEQSNKQLEVQIREFASNTSIDGFDWSKYDQIIPPLQAQIQQSIIENSTIALEIDNAKLAAEDFQSKWQTEQGIRMSVEADIDGLHNLKATYVQLQENLNQDIVGMQDEIAFLKKNHEEELRMLRQQKTQDIEVQVDSGPSLDLDRTLAELREKYSNQARDNKADMDKWYLEQVQIKETTVLQHDQALDGAKNEMSQYRHQLQNLDMEYNSLLGSINALENSLNQIDGSYDMQLQTLHSRIAQLEGELGSIRNELIHQNTSYENLLNIKMQLESEISQYRMLLNGGQQGIIGSSSGFSSSTSGGTTGSGSGKVTITSVTETRQTVS